MSISTTSTCPLKAAWCKQVFFSCNVQYTGTYHTSIGLNNSKFVCIIAIITKISTYIQSYVIYWNLMGLNSELQREINQVVV